MRKPDPDIWNRRTILAVFIEFIIALNIDIYGSAYTFWMSIHSLGSLIALAVIITTIVDATGWIISGVLVDRYGTKKVQMVSLSVLLITGAVGAMFDGVVLLCCLFVRFLTCGIALIANQIQIKGQLPEDKLAKGWGQLFVVGFVGAVIGACIGSWLASEHQAVWKWAGPILTFFGIVALIYTQQSNRIPKETSILPHPQVFQLVFPVMSISICQGAMAAYIIVDLGVRDGSLVRAGTYVGSGVVGWILPSLLKHINEKAFIRMGMFLMSGAWLFLYWQNFAGLMVASFAIGFISNGIVSQILGTKVFLLTDQKGRASSTSKLVSGGSRIIGIYGLALVRDHVGEAMWLILPILLLFSLPAFEWSFRHSYAWKK
jgi:MFS family permease